MLLSGQPCGLIHIRGNNPRPTARPGGPAETPGSTHRPAPAAGVARGGGGGSVPLPLDAFGDSQ